MAEQKKKAAAVKNNTGKSKTNNKNNSAKKSDKKGSSSVQMAADTKKDGMRKEFVIIIMAGIAVLLFAFLISGSSAEAGIIGEAAVLVLHGIFGVGAWILPIALIIGAVYLGMEKNDAIFKIRAVFSAVLFVVILAFVQSFGGSEQFEGLNFPAFVSYAFRHGAGSNGGLVGALVYMGLNKLVGNIGCYIIFILLAIILLMLISGGSFIGGIRNLLGYVDRVKEKYADYYYDEDDYYNDNYYDEEINNEPVRSEKKLRKQMEEEREPKRSLFAPKEEERHEKIFTIDIKKSEKRDNKIDLITDGIGNSAPINDEVDRTGMINLYTKASSAQDDSNMQESIPVYEPKEEIVEDKVVDDEKEQELIRLIDSFNKSSVPERKPVPEDLTPDLSEDLPPWEEGAAADGELYSAEDEPEIVEAEKTKLVDKLEIEKKKTEYKFPKLEFLGVNPDKSEEKTKEEILRKAKKLEETLGIFKVEAKVNHISIGPTVTRYELTPSKGTKVSAVTNLENDIKFSMAAESIIIEAPIPGKSAIGIEIPNDTRESVYFSEVLRSEQFQKFKSKIAFGLGKDITGSVTVADLAKMPHLLVAGTTGSGKSVCINTLVMSILYKATPDEVKMIMVDPKMVELSVYNGIPHLLLPVVTEPEKAAGALNWAVIEMERRYKLLAKSGTRNLEGYNQKVSKEERLSQIVIIIDELADLMMVVGKEIETSICRLAQKARAAGMHLVLATQRPSADVLTGLIRSNVPSRIAFKVSGSMDSRIILDSTGAEKLLGKGDMLFKTADMAKPMRIQGAFITDDEVERVVSYIGTDEPQYDEAIINEINKASITVTEGADGGEDDPMTDEVLDWIVANPKCASAGKVQRHFRIGFNRASRIIEALEDRGILGPTNGSQPREVYMDKYELRERKDRYDSYEDL